MSPSPPPDTGGSGTADLRSRRRLPICPRLLTTDTSVCGGGGGSIRILHGNDANGT